MKLQVRAEIQPAKLLSALMVGAIVGIREIIFVLSMGSLIFSGDQALVGKEAGYSGRRLAF